MSPSKRVEFHTIDGVTLRGDLYMPDDKSERPSPIVVMTQGVLPFSLSLMFASTTLTANSSHS